VTDDLSEEHRGVTRLGAISPGYFQILATPLPAPGFRCRDTATSLKVAIVNQEFARKFVNNGGHGADPASRVCGYCLRSGRELLLRGA